MALNAAMWAAAAQARSECGPKSLYTVTRRQNARLKSEKNMLKLAIILCL
jgi:hypothetical protein